MSQHQEFKVKTALFTFRDESQRSRFVKLLYQYATELEKINAESADGSEDSVFLTQAIETMRLDPLIKSITERVATLFVSGRKLTEGMLSDMKKRFDQEIASHSANTELREWQDGEWKVIQSRRLQKASDR